MNKIELIGRLVADPELSVTADGLEMLKFRLAVHRAKSKEKTADFIPCKAWGKTAAFISGYFGKGDMLALDGSLQSWRYVDGEGHARNLYEVQVEQAYFCGCVKKRATGLESGGLTNQLELEDVLQ